MGELITQGPQEQDRKKVALASIVGGEVLPALRVYYPNSDFVWRGDIKIIANEYALQLSGLGVTAANVRGALDKSRLRSSSERYAPTPIEFKVLCLQSKGMPTLEACIEEINELRITRYGLEKTFSSPMVYWLNQKTAASRAKLADHSWQKLLSSRYTELADLYGKGELPEIPKMVEHVQQPAYMKY